MPGGERWTLDLAHPIERQRSVARLEMRRGSLSTSGGSERDLHVNGRRIGHHLDPRTGWPASFEGSVAVWHERGLVADMLSTALYVMGPDEGLQWGARRRLAAAYLVPDQGLVRIFATPEMARWVKPIGCAGPAAGGNQPFGD
jgi:thiamine biosynthesis lipoprotein